ncbi:hypothetical protein ACIBL3_37845 [Kribbella sp. NPDC050124]|uniref:hypothetical protein n=1 Tax=Kribbella sp. NPDC050124 TaxID=3364114 RepID=UPI003791EC9A
MRHPSDLAELDGIPAWLEEPPSAVPDPVTVTAPQELPFEHLTAQNFERLVLALARRTFLVGRAGQYGEPGQKQDGIDLYLRLTEPGDAGRPFVTVQCRNIARVTPTAIDRVVDDLLAGGWAERTATFVLAIRAPTRRTEVVEAVEAAADRLTKQGIQFEVWDSQALSERLLDRPGLVERFFGAATRSMYCVIQDDPAPAQPLRDHVLPDRWKLAPVGPGLVSLINGLKDISSPYQPVADAAPAAPTVRVGLQVGALPLPDYGLTTSFIRRRFIDFLADQPVAELIHAICAGQEPQAWGPYADIGRSHYAAIRTGFAEDPVPSAWARLMFPTDDQISIGRDHRCAALVIHMDWFAEPGAQVRGPVGLLDWRAIMRSALSLPTAFATFLRDELATTPQPSPPASIGFWLGTTSNLTELIDTTGFAQVAGTRTSPWFDAYAVAEPDSERPAQIVNRWITQLCDNALHLDDYENSV